MTRHVLGLDHEFHRRHTPGELIQRVDGDVTSVSDFLGRVVSEGGRCRAAGVRHDRSCWRSIDWRLALGADRRTSRVAVAVVVRSRHRAVGESSDEMGSYARLYGGIEERLTAAEDLRANGAGAHAMWRFVEESADAMASSVRREQAFLRMWWAVQGSVAGGSAVALAVGAALVAAEAISVGTAFLLFQYVLLLSRPLEDVVHQLETVQKANGAMVRVLDLLAVRPTIVDRAAPAHRRPARCRSASTTSASTTATTRPCSGRSTWTVARRPVGRRGRSHRQRQDDAVAPPAAPRRGDRRARCPLGGVPIADIPLAELRRRVALIPQEVELFAGTVRDNVDAVRRRPSDEEVGGRAPPSRPRRAGRRRHRSSARSGRRRAVRRRGPAAGARPRVAARARTSSCSTRPPHASIRRPRRGSSDAVHELMHGPHDADHRPPPVDAAPRRRDRRDRARPRGRARRPRLPAARMPIPPPAPAAARARRRRHGEVDA